MSNGQAIQADIAQVTEDRVISQIQGNQKALEWAILHMLARQTTDELASESTKYDNSVGFNAADAGYFTYLGEYMTGSGMPGPGMAIKRHLSGRHLQDARKRILKYKRQIAEIVNAERERRASAKLGDG